MQYPLQLPAVQELSLNHFLLKKAFLYKTRKLFRAK